MIAENFHDFFVATTGAAAALIGLLFVAISVAPERLREEETRVQSQLLAGGALLTLTNVLLVSVVALIPETNIGWIAAALGAGGLVFAAANGRLLATEVREGVGKRSAFTLVIALLVTFGFETVSGGQLIAADHAHGAVSTIAGVLAASLAIGVNRSWELVGMRDTGITSSTLLLFRRGGSTRAGTAANPPRPAGTGTGSTGTTSTAAISTDSPAMTQEGGES